MFYEGNNVIKSRPISEVKVEGVNESSTKTRHVLTLGHMVYIREGEYTSLYSSKAFKVCIVND